MLGKGGMGSVWLAQHIGLDIPCAVKFISADGAANPDARARFEREAKAAAQLHTPNVVQILDYGLCEGTPYIAMELLVGEPLSARLASRGRLDAQETLRIAWQIGRALTKAHQAGIVHRDLKPENVFLVADEEGEIAKVLDFGVAKQTIGLTDSNTKTGALLGTPFYMSPEQAQGTKTVDSRADLWSLAVLCYRCITGELPFRSEALGDLLIKIVMQPLPMPSHVARGVPTSLDAWWERAAQRDPDRRFQTAKELVEALAVALGQSLPNSMGLAGALGTAASLPLAAAQPGTPHAAASGPWEASQPGLLSETQAPSTTPWQRPATPFSAGAPQAPGAATGPSVQSGPQPSVAPHLSEPLPGTAPSPYPRTTPFPAVPGPFAATQSSPSPLAAPAPQPFGSVGLAPLSAESGSGPSVAGFATQARGPASTKRGAVIGGIVAFALLFGVASSLLLYRGISGSRHASSAEAPAPSALPGETDPKGSASAEPTASSSGEARPEDSAYASATASGSASAPDVAASAEPSTSPSVEVAVTAKGTSGAPGGGKPETSAKAKGRPIATSLDVEPKPTSTGKPHDFGF
jgi:serine/threonine-protein kinase